MSGASALRVLPVQAGGALALLGSHICPQPLHFIGVQQDTSEPDGASIHGRIHDSPRSQLSA